MPRIAVLTALVFALALPLFAQKKGDAPKKNAPACPVSGKPASETIFAAHKGGRVFFDSDESKQKFSQNSAQYTPAANYQLFVTGQARQLKCPILNKNLGATAINVGGIGVCCPGCQRKIAAMNQAQRLNLMFGNNFDRFYVVAKAR